MKTDAIVIALLVLLVILVVGYAYSSSCRTGTTSGFNPSPESILLSRSPGGGPGCRGSADARAAANAELEILRYGAGVYGAHQVPLHEDPQAMGAYVRSAAAISPEEIVQSELSSWFPSSDAEGSGEFDPEVTANGGSDTLQRHASKPAIDYVTVVTDLVTDPRMLDNQQRFANEMGPWSGVSMNVDTIEVENYLDWRGLRRPQPVVQVDPFFVTEVDTFDVARGANEFRFTVY